MSSTRELQRSLNGGEISPRLYGRLDLRNYKSGLALARNYVCTVEGPLENRAGLKYDLETKDSSKQSVLLPFSFNDEQSYILEFGDLYVRFHTPDGGAVLETAQSVTAITQANPGVVTKVAHGYSNGDWVYFLVAGMTELNGRFAIVANKTADTFELTNIHGGANLDTSGYGAFTSGTMARVYEVVTPYVEADLFELHITQSADVLTITHNDYAPRELSRAGAADWSLALKGFRYAPFQRINNEETQRIWASDSDGTITLEANYSAFTSDMVGQLVRLEVSDLDTTRFWESGKSTSAGDIRRSGDRFYQAAVGGTTGGIPPTHEKGQRYDGGGGSTVLWSFLHFGYGVAEITGFTSATEVDAEVIEPIPESAVSASAPTNNWNVNGDGTSGPFSITGATSSTSSDYQVVKVDTVGWEADKLLNTNKYTVDGVADTITLTFNLGSRYRLEIEESVVGTSNFAFDAWHDSLGYPAAASYFGGRLGFAGSPSFPNFAWLSEPDGFDSYYGGPTLEEDDPIAIALGDTKANVIRDLVPLQRLVALTASRAWSFVPNIDNVLTPTATAQPGEAVGISRVQAEVVGGQALYVDQAGNSLQKLSFGQLPSGEVGYLSDDLSLLAEHLTRDKTIVDIAYQRKPQPILWAVRDDGALLGFTFSEQHQVTAWHQHTTNGFFESVAVASNGTEDRAYFVVRRTINGRTVRNVEHLASRLFTSKEDGFFVDSGATYSGAAATTISGLHHLAGEDVSVLADGGVEYHTVSADGEIELDAEASTVHIGLAYTSDFQTLPMALALAAQGQGAIKNIGRVYLRFLETLGGKIGPSFDDLVEIPFRTSEDYGESEAVFSGLLEVPIEQTWDLESQFVMRHELPTPSTIQTLVAEVEISE